MRRANEVLRYRYCSAFGKDPPCTSFRPVCALPPICFVSSPPHRVMEYMRLIVHISREDNIHPSRGHDIYLELYSFREMDHDYKHRGSLVNSCATISQCMSLSCHMYVCVVCVSCLPTIVSAQEAVWMEPREGRGQHSTGAELGTRFPRLRP